MNIDYRFYYWGPFLWKSKIPLDICEEMLTRFSKSNLDHAAGLASIIKTVNRIDDRDDRGWFVNKINPYLDCYLNLRKEYYNLPDTVDNQLELHKLWINVQKQHEYNPEHWHGGDLSFVIYLQMPDAIREENKKFVGKSGGPGAIMFRYGEFSNWSVNNHQFMPEVGDIFIFPAQLAHGVYPFYSDAERISVSGNFGFVND